MGSAATAAAFSVRPHAAPDGKCTTAEHLVGDGIARPGSPLIVIGKVIRDEAFAERAMELMQDSGNAQHMRHFPFDGEGLLPVRPDDVQPDTVGFQDRFDMSACNIERSRIVQRHIEALHEDCRLDIQPPSPEQAMLVGVKGEG